jgi:hypothetical protein
MQLKYLLLIFAFTFTSTCIVSAGNKQFLKFIKINILKLLNGMETVWKRDTEPVAQHGLWKRRLSTLATAKKRDSHVTPIRSDLLPDR